VNAAIRIRALKNQVFMSVHGAVNEQWEESQETRVRNQESFYPGSWFLTPGSVIKQESPVSFETRLL
jgi:predicted amidohydrolase